MEVRRPRFLGWRALFTFLWIDIGFRLFGFEKVQRWIAGAGKEPRWRDPQEIDRDEVAQTQRAVQWATKLYYRRRLDCLPKALTTYRLLKLQRIPAALYLGVKKYPFGGHAWVEYQGEVIDDRPGRVKSYTPLKRLA